MSGSNLNKVFYAESYHPIQAGSIDGTDILPHDNAVYRALLCSSAGLYDPYGDPKVIGDPYCTVFVGRLSRFTDEDTLKKAMNRYGRVKNLRLVRHIVTGASRGYAFVEYETEREMRRAYEEAHHTFIDDSEIIVDYNRQQLMPGWIPRRLGGGLGGKKESGQLRFGGRERPFRAPLRPIPYDDLKRLGIPPPPEGLYLTRFEIPPPPRRRNADDGEDLVHRDRRRTEDRNPSPPPGHRRRKSVEGREASRRSRKRADDDYEGHSPQADPKRTKYREDSPPRYRGGRRSTEPTETSTRRSREGSEEGDEEEHSSRGGPKRSADGGGESPPAHTKREHASTRSWKRSGERDSGSDYRGSRVSAERRDSGHSHRHREGRSTR